MQQQQSDYTPTPIADEICETAVLGTLLSLPAALDKARGLLTERCFTKPQHIIIFRAIMAVDSRGDVADIVSVWEELQKNPPQFTIQPTDLAVLPNSRVSFIETHIARLVELAHRRDFALIVEKFRSAATDESVKIEELLMSARSDIDNLLTSNSPQTLTFKDSLKSVTHIIQDNKSGTKKLGTRTGFRLLDKFGGFHGGDLIIMAGDTSSGKTSFALSIVRNMIMNDTPIAYYSMEMQHYQLTARIMAMQSGVTSASILYRPLNENELHRTDVATSQLVNRHLYYDDKSVLSMATILASIRSMHIKYGIQGAFVDYLQIINLGESKGKSREQATADAARDLKNLAKSLDIWIVALSQLARRNANNTDVIPTMDRLRGSGQIAEAADSVLLVYRPEYYGADVKFPKPYKDHDTHNKAMIIVPKGRNVGVGEFICNFIPELTLFTEDDISNIPSVHSDTTKPQPTTPQNSNNYEQNEFGDTLPF